MESKDSSKEKMALGEILIAEGLLTREQLGELLILQKQQSRYKPLGELCIEKGYLTKEDLKGIMRAHKKRIMLGDLFVNLGIITPNQLSEALLKQKVSGKRLGETLIETGIISDEDLARALSLQLDIPLVKPDLAIIDKNLLTKVHENYLRSSLSIPIVKHEEVITVVMADPLREDLIKDLSLLYNCKVEAAVAARAEIINALDQIYSPMEIKEATRIYDRGTPSRDLVISGIAGAGKEDHIVNIVNHLVSNGIKEKASDIHVECLVDRVRVRYRIDGILQHKTDFPMSLGFPIVSRIKILAGLDIAERRRHQDGRIEATLMGKDVDLRVSTYASVYGEAVVIRVLQKRTSLVELDNLGFSPAVKKRFERLLQHPSGVILVTGPTGSGKTTTLYAALAYLNGLDRKIITVEDPVEMTIDGVVQGMLNPKIHLTYMDFIKSMMRQDPDVIMIGEIRDREVAQATVQAGLTGHKVFSTFHTEDSAGALLRLIDMGVDPFLISSTVSAVLAQRLVRLVCPNCREEEALDKNLLDFFKVKTFDPYRHKFYRGKGCPECNFTGFKARTGIHELLVLNDPIRNAVLVKKDSSEIRAVARARAGLITLKEDGLYKCVKGITSPWEIFRVAHYVESDEISDLDIDDVIRRCEG